MTPERVLQEGRGRGGGERGLLSTSSCEVRGRLAFIYHLGPGEVGNGLVGLRKSLETVSG